MEDFKTNTVLLVIYFLLRKLRAKLKFKIRAQDKI